MKKFGIFIFLSLLSALFIIGCGSNTKADPAHSSTGPYMIVNASSPFEVSDTNISYELYVQLLKDGYGYEGAEIRIQPFDAMYGRVSPSMQITDIDGWAKFPYTPPTDIKPLIGQSAVLHAVFDDGNGSVLVKDIILNFVTPKPTPTPTPTPCTGTTGTTGTCPLAK